MRRRQFVRLVGGAAVAVWPLVAYSEESAKPVIGFLGSASAAAWVPIVAAFRDGLNETGFVEGRNVAIEFRYAEGHYDRLPALAAELVSRKVNVIFANGGSAPALAAKAATTTIPIVFETGGDPVRAGLVASLNRPGGNITGVTWTASALSAKRLDLLHQIVPKASTIGLMVNPNYPEAKLQVSDLQEAATALGVQIYPVNVSSEDAADKAFAELAQRNIAALLVANDPFLATFREQLVALSRRYAIATIYPLREDAQAGGLISYGTSLPEQVRQGGIYTGRILKGAAPAELPVLQPTRFTMVINLKTARALGLEVPPGIMAITDEVIE